MKARPAPPSILPALCTVGSQGLLLVKQLTSSGEMIERLPIHPQELGPTCSIASHRNLGFYMVMTKLDLIWFFLWEKIGLNVCFNGFPIVLITLRGQTCFW